MANQGTYAPQPAARPRSCTASWAASRWTAAATSPSGYTRSSAQNISGTVTGNASAVYTGRVASDPNGLLPQPEITIQPGTGALGAGGADTRWGDYYTMVVDPIDDCTFWYTGDYATTVRQSLIASFRFSDCATDLEISKTVSPAHPNAGEEIVYTITVTNDGPIGAANVVVTDQLPAAFNYLANTDSCTGVAVGATGTLTCPLGTIAAGSSVSFQIKGSIDPDLGGATAITNTATVSSDGERVRPGRQHDRADPPGQRAGRRAGDQGVQARHRAGPCRHVGRVHDLGHQRRPVGRSPRQPRRHPRQRRAVQPVDR